MLSKRTIGNRVLKAMWIRVIVTRLFAGPKYVFRLYDRTIVSGKLKECS